MRWTKLLAEIITRLRCPVCAAELAAAGGALRCGQGHSYDIARQGYVNLLTGRAPAIAETPEMVAARAALFDAGIYQPLMDAVAQTATDLVGGRARAAGRGLVVDIGAGTGHYLAAVLDRLDDHVGLALDLAKPAVRLAARAHERASAAVGDVWQRLPVADGAADLVLDIFAPRNGAEFRRVLAADGFLVVVTPQADHLSELVRALGLIGVDPSKSERLQSTLGDHFTRADRHQYEFALALRRPEAQQVVGMGPSAWHADPATIAGRLARLPEPIATAIRVDLHVYAPRS